MIRLNNICLQFVTQAIFKNVDWFIRSTDRMGLVGPNGSGKTTLLKILLGKQHIDFGKIDRAKDIKVGYLPQDGVQLKEKTLLEETLSAFQFLLDIEKEIRDLHKKISDSSNHDSPNEQLLKRLGHLQNQFEHADGYSIEFEAKKILKGLGFEEGDWTRPTSTFSGGWQMRISLAKLLLIKPSLLMLDEPTNHLDIQTTEWLENYLQTYDGAFILVSHDRYFLDRTVKKIISVENFGLQPYPGNYSFYEKEYKKRVEIQKQAYLRQKEEIERIQKFIDRFRYKATKAAQVQSRVKMLEKMEKIHLPSEETSVNFHFPSAPKSGKLMLELENVAKYYGEKQVFSGVSFRCDRSDRIALVGVNGAGKSTLCKILAYQETNTEGKIVRDAREKIGYYSQETADQLESSQKVLDEAMNHAGNMNPNQVRTILGAFLFSGDDVYKQIKVLSGGEKSRLALACLLFQPANLLILDEPTNHLDLASKNILYEALKSFEGTIILVSHDRYFVDKIVDRVIEIFDGQICQFWGNYTDYLSKKEAEKKVEEEKKSLQNNNVYDETISIKKKSKEQKRLEAEERNKRFLKRKDFEKRQKELETEIEKLERKKEELEVKLSNPETFKLGNDVQKIQVEFSTTSKNLLSLYEEWERELEKIEQLNQGLFE